MMVPTINWWRARVQVAVISGPGLLEPVFGELSAMKSVLKLIDFKEKEVFIQAPWGRLAALSWGEVGAPPVLLCHGIKDVCSGFRPLIARLPRSFHYVSLECPGNGKSDPMPSKARYTTADLVPAVLAVKEHFKWDTFFYIGHSLGVVIGKYFNFAYPGIIRRMVELDPVPAYDAWIPENFGAWYHLFYGEYYLEHGYTKYTASRETAPKYTYEKALELITNARGLTRDAAEHVLERALEPAEEGLYRFTYDQRQKQLTRFPLSPEFMKQLYTSTTTPTFCVLATAMIELGAYRYTPFIKDEKAWPHRNYKVKIVEGGHDVHISNPDCMAEDISKFLLHEYKTKL